MTWARIDDRMHSHPKTLAIWQENRGSLGLFLLAISYCADHLTDGIVPKTFVLQVLPRRIERDRLVGPLVEYELWSEHPEGWKIHDWLDYNPSRADIAERREGARIRKALSRAGQSSPNGVTRLSRVTDS